MVAPYLVFMAAYLLVQLVRQSVDCSVHVGGGILCEQRFTGGMDRSLSLLLLGIFYFENDINGYHVIEVPGNPLKFFSDICSQRGGYFNVMSCYINLHVSLRVMPCA